MTNEELGCLTKAYKEHHKEMEEKQRLNEKNAFPEGQRSRAEFGGGCIVGHVLCFIEICLLVLAAWIGKCYWR